MKTVRSVKAVFHNEAALCAAFIASLPDDWTAYPETAGYDILLVRKADGAQIGVEAKMTLNAKVLLQAVEGMYYRREASQAGPDFRAALVPSGSAGAEMQCIARYLGIRVIECREPFNGQAEIDRQVAQYMAGDFSSPKQEQLYRKWAEADVKRNWKPFEPELPVLGGYDWRSDWVDHCPAKRCAVPEYVPDVIAGASGPSQLSDWKVKAIKICVLLERRGFVTIADFKAIEIDRKRWLDMHWLTFREVDGLAVRGNYVAGSRPLDLKAQHPVNYGQIEADFEKWQPKEETPAQPALL